MAAKTGTTGRLGSAALAAAALLAAALVYSPSRSLSFVFDDFVVVAFNEYMHSTSPAVALSENPYRAAANLTYWAQVQLHSPAPGEVMTLAEAGPGLRQVTENGRIVTYYRDPLMGEQWPAVIERGRGLVFPLVPSPPFRRFNLIVHLLNAFLLYSIVKKLTPGPAPTFALFLFLLHPLATEPVNFITSRFDLMALGFSLAALRVHLEAHKRPRADIAAALLYLLALFSKETAAPLPLIAFLLDLATGKYRPRVLWGLALAAAYVAARSTWIVILASGRTPPPPWPRYLLLEQSVTWLYLGKALLPVNLNFDYDFRPALARDLFAAAANLILASLALLALARQALALRAGKLNNNSLAPAARAGALFLIILAALSPTSSVIPLGDLVREARAYPLIAALAGGLAAAFAPLLRRETKKTAAILIAVCALLGVASFERNREWRDDISLFGDTLRKSPAKSRVTYHYSSALIWRERFEEALFWSRVTVSLDPNHDKARFNIMLLEQKLGLDHLNGREKDHSLRP